MLLCLSPWLVGGGVLGMVLTGLVVALIVGDKHPVTREHDWVQAYGALEQKLRQIGRAHV